MLSCFALRDEFVLVFFVFGRVGTTCVPKNFSPARGCVITSLCIRCIMPERQNPVVPMMIGVSDMVGERL
jgi:hypothetical protein